MNTENKHRHLRHLIAGSFVLGAVVGAASSGIAEGDLQKLFWGISAFFIIIGSALLASKLSREDHDIPAAGFAVLAIGESMAYSFIATHDTGLEQYGAAIIIFVPSLLLISIYSQSPLLLRMLGFISAISFGILSILIYTERITDLQRGILSLSSYAALNFLLIGWAWRLYKNKV